MVPNPAQVRRLMVKADDFGHRAGTLECGAADSHPGEDIHPAGKQPPTRWAQSQYPGLRALTAGLTELLSAGEPGAGSVAVVDRAEATHCSSFPSEVVNCRVDGRLVRLFCKYSRRRRRADPLWHQAHGHRKGVAYEAQVYDVVLHVIELPTARFLGAHCGASGRTWLVLEHLDDVALLNKVPDSAAMPRAARWIGRFHALATPAPFLGFYDAGYYRGWADRTVTSMRRAAPRGQWPSRLGDRFDDAIRILLAADPTVIHGEYYPNNILVRGATIYPVDWETAAIAAGEIDLAFLTDNWPEEVVRDCELAYQQARWPDGPPSTFAETLRAARFYLLLRWAGEPGAWTSPDSRDFHLERLREQAEQLGAG